MVNFGETLVREKESSPWAPYYLDYDFLKKILEEHCAAAATVSARHQQQHKPRLSFDAYYEQDALSSTGSLGDGAAATMDSSQRRRLLFEAQNVITEDFLTQLHAQVERLVLFVLQEQGKIASELRLCRGELPSSIDISIPSDVASRRAQSDSLGEYSLQSFATMDSSSNTHQQQLNDQGVVMEKLNALEEHYCQVGLHLLRLYHFVNFNVSATRKILKKHDKLRPRHKISVAWLSGSGSGGNSGGPSSPHHSYLYTNTTTMSSSHANSVSSSGGGVALSSPRLGSLSGRGLFPRRQRLSATAYGNALVKPLLRDECLGALAVMLEAGLQKVYAYQRYHHQFQLGPTRSGSIEPGSQQPTAENAPLESSSTLEALPSSQENHTSDHLSPLHTFSDHRRASHSGELLVLPPPSAGAANAHSKPQSQSQPPPPPPSYSSAKIHDRKTYRLVSNGRSKSFSLSGHGRGSSQHGGSMMATADSNTILWQIQAARRRLHETSSFVHLLAAPMLVAAAAASDDGMASDDDMNVGDEAAALLDDNDAVLLFDLANEEAKQRRATQVSSTLNLLSTLLYMCNYYIVAPTSVNYAQKLGGTAALASLIIGMTPVAALVSTVLYSWWTSHSYKSALIFASACSALGNLLYAAGLPFDSLSLVMMGRLLNGFGSARSINRRYICDTFPRDERTAASAAFVSAGALGMAAGPAIASVLHFVTTDDNGNALNDGIYWQAENAPGWFMFGTWTVYLICLVLYFEDPPKKKEALKKATSSLALNKDETNHLLGKSAAISSNSDGPTEPEKEPPIWRNVPVMITFTLYFVLKLVLEGVLSSTAMLTDFYFDWHSGLVGLYLAALGLLMLPANMCVAMMSAQGTYDDRDLIVGIQVFMFLGCVGMLQYTAVYTVWQYVLASIVLFISTNALEGPNMSLLSKTIPSSWSKGIFNVGLLATEAGTLGRAVGDVLLTVFGSAGLEHLLNQTFGSFSILSLATLVVSYCYNDHLEPSDEQEY